MAKEDKLFSGGKEIISSGTFISFSNEPSQLHFYYNNEEYILEIAFEGDQTKHTNIYFGPDGEKIKFTFKNFNNEVAAINIETAHFAIIENRPAYANFVITDLKSLRKKITYTIYLGEP